METELTTADEIGEVELAHRVLFALLRSVVRIAGVFRVPLKDVVQLLESAYFREMRGRAPTLRALARELGVSQRTADRLAAQNRATFLVPELEHHLPRRIEFMLAAEPASLARLGQLLPDVTEDEIARVIEALTREGRLERDGERTVVYRPVPGVRTLPRDTWVRRVGALTSFSDNLADAVFGRFFRNDDRAFARTLTFSMLPSDLQLLSEWYQRQMLPKIVELSDAAEGDAGAEAMQLSLCWAPYETVAQEHTSATSQPAASPPKENL